jgi:hypothetical protein
LLGWEKRERKGKVKKSERNRDSGRGNEEPKGKGR